jgi:hypothetical protein
MQQAAAASRTSSGAHLRGGVCVDPAMLVCGGPLHGGIFRHGIVVLHVIEPIAEARNHASVRPLEIELVLVIAPDLEPALVQQRVMKGAQQREVLEARLSPIRPMLDVVRIDIAAIVGVGRNSRAWQVSCTYYQG